MTSTIKKRVPSYYPLISEKTTQFTNLNWSFHRRPRYNFPWNRPYVYTYFIICVKCLLFSIHSFYNTFLPSFALFLYFTVTVNKENYSANIYCYLILNIKILPSICINWNMLSQKKRTSIITELECWHIFGIYLTHVA